MWTDKRKERAQKDHSMERELRAYIMPNILAMIGTSFYILADTFFISMAEGSNGITALNLALPVYALIFAIGAMIGIGSATRYALERALGGLEADSYFSNSVFCTVAVSLIFIAAGIFCPALVLRLMGADDTILAIGRSYIRLVLCFAPMFMLNYTFTAFVRNDGDPKVAMAATLSSGIFNVLFDYVLMFPCRMGMIGAALATGLSPIVSMSVCMLHYLSKKNTVRFVWRLPSWRRFLSSCCLGAASFVGEISSGITTMVFNLILLGLVGNVAVAAYGIAANYALVATMIFNGVSQGLQPLASQVHGAEDMDGERRIYRHSMQIALILAAALVLAVMAFTGPCVALFNRESSVELAQYAGVGLRLYFLGFLLASVNLVQAGFCSATNQAGQAAVISVSRGVVAITVFAFVLSGIWGMTGVWLAFPASELFTFLLSVCIRCRGGKAAKDRAR